MTAHQIFEDSTHFSPKCFVIRLNISISFTLLSHNTIPKPLALLIALIWTCFRFSVVTLKYAMWTAFKPSWGPHLPYWGLLPTQSWYNLNVLSCRGLAIVLLAIPSVLSCFILSFSWLTQFIHGLVISKTILLRPLIIEALNLCVHVSQSSYILPC